MFFILFQNSFFSKIFLFFFQNFFLFQNSFFSNFFCFFPKILYFFPKLIFSFIFCALLFVFFCWIEIDLPCWLMWVYIGSGTWNRMWSPCWAGSCPLAQSSSKCTSSSRPSGPTKSTTSTDSCCWSTSSWPLSPYASQLFAPISSW